MSDQDRPRMTMRRLVAFALVPLSAIPFAIAAPLVGPSVDKRVNDLRDRPAEQRAPRARPNPPVADLRSDRRLDKSERTE